MLLTVLAAAALQPPAAPPPIANQVVEAPSAEAEQGIRASTEAYLRAKQEGRYDAAWAMLDPTQQARRPREAWEGESRGFNESAGPLRERHTGGITWIRNPAGTTDFIAGISYSADHPNLVFACGVLIWRQQPAGNWLLYREVHHAALREDAPNATPEQVAEVRAQSQCPD